MVRSRAGGAVRMASFTYRWRALTGMVGGLLLRGQTADQPPVDEDVVEKPSCCCMAFSPAIEVSMADHWASSCNWYSASTGFHAAMAWRRVVASWFCTRM